MSRLLTPLGITCLSRFCHRIIFDHPLSDLHRIHHRYYCQNPQTTSLHNILALLSYHIIISSSSHFLPASYLHSSSLRKNFRQYYHHNKTSLLLLLYCLSLVYCYDYLHYRILDENQLEGLIPASPCIQTQIKGLLGDYDAVHVHREDKIKTRKDMHSVDRALYPHLDRDTRPEFIQQRIAGWIPPGRTLFVASNEISPGF